MADLRFAVLGSLQVWRGSEEIRLGSKRERAVLAILLLRAGSPVPRQEIIDLVWANDMPPSGVNLVHTYIGRLRSRLDPDRVAPGDTAWLVRVGSAYQIQPDHCDIDLLRFRAKVTAAKRATSPHHRLSLLLRSLSIWRGSCLSDLEHLLTGHSRVRAIDQERVDALVEAAQIACQVGQVAEVLPQLRELASSEPLNEAVHACLITALAAAGVQAQALAEYEGIRARLADQLGVDPGPQLRQAHMQVLRQEVQQLRQEVVLTRGRPVPAMLPAGTADFTGRTDLLERLHTTLIGEHDGPAVNVVTVVGRNGVGKSALAVHLAHRVQEWYPDGQLYADLRGTDEAPLEPSRVLGRFLRVLGGDEPLPDDLDERAALFRSRMSGRRMLVLLDDVADQAQLRPLLPGSPTVSVIVASRYSQLSVPGAHRIELDVPTGRDALRLLIRIVGADAVAREPAAAAELLRLCGRLPLALRAVSARLTTRPHWTLADLVERLAEPEQRLDELVHADLDVRATFAAEYRRLDARVQRAYRLLGLLDAETFAPWLAAAVLDTDPDDAERLLESLVDSYLLEVAGTDGVGQTRYRFRELAQLYARERATTGSRPDARAAVIRALTTQLALAQDACARLTDLAAGGRAQLPWAAQPGGIRGRLLIDPRSWLASEAPGLLAAALQAANLGLDNLAWALDETWRRACAGAGLDGPTATGQPNRQTAVPSSVRTAPVQTHMSPFSGRGTPGRSDRENQSVPVTPDLDTLIANYATAGYTGSTPLLEAGIESLSLLRLAVSVMANDDAEIDATRLVDLRTIDDLKDWLAELAGGAC